jgi:hypothetical protein
MPIEKPMPAMHLRFVVPVVALVLAGVALAALTVSRNTRSEESATVARSGLTNEPTARTTSTPTQPSAKPVSKRPAPQRPLERALARNRIVVAVLYRRHAVVDTLAVREARAAAASVGAGFVAVRPADAARFPLLTRGGVAATPTVFVFRRGPQLVHRIAGFADRETVAQAAANAARP